MSCLHLHKELHEILHLNNLILSLLGASCNCPINACWRFLRYVVITGCIVLIRYFLQKPPVFVEDDRKLAVKLLDALVEQKKEHENIIEEQKKIIADLRQHQEWHENDDGHRHQVCINYHTADEMMC
jgi:hypothetical protein